MGFGRGVGRGCNDTSPDDLADRTTGGLYIYIYLKIPYISTGTTTIPWLWLYYYYTQDPPYAKIAPHYWNILNRRIYLIILLYLCVCVMCIQGDLFFKSNNDFILDRSYNIYNSHNSFEGKHVTQCKYII